MIPQRPFYFLRHGETDWKAGIRGNPISSSMPLGIAQAQAAAERLTEVSIDRIVSSPLIRALATAAIVAERLQKPIPLDRALATGGICQPIGLAA
jgi:broad specificity phosphatase PhoE